VAKDRDREIAVAVGDGVEKRPQLGGRRAEVAVTEQGKLRLRLGIERRDCRRGHVRAFAVRSSAAHDLRPVGDRDLGGRVLGGVVGDPDGRAGERLGKRADRRSDPVGFVSRRDDDEDAGVGRSRRALWTRSAGKRAWLPFRRHGRLFCRA
jgi:hypothetical protein